MLTRREKLIVAAVPIGIVLVAVWFLWLSPRLMFHGIAGGDWSDFSDVKHQRAGGETVISFQVRNREVLDGLIDRLEFHQGALLGNAAEISEASLRSAGFKPNQYRKYYSSGPNLIFLYTYSNECVLVIINV